MGNERKFVTGVAVAIGLAIVPLTGSIYWCLAVILAALCARLACLTFRSAWARVLSSAGAVAAVAVILAPHIV